MGLRNISDFGWKSYLVKLIVGDKAFSFKNTEHILDSNEDETIAFAV